MSAISDLIAVVRDAHMTDSDSPWRARADAAEKELAERERYTAVVEALHDRLRADVAAQPRIDLEALRKALVDAAKNVQLPPHYQWSESNQSKFRFGAESAAAAVDALLAQAQEFAAKNGASK